MPCKDGCHRVMDVHNFGCHIAGSAPPITPSMFVSCRWSNGLTATFVYLVYRILIAAGFSTAIVFLNLGKDAESFKRWMTFMTNWSFLVLACNTLVQALLVAFGLSRFIYNNYAWDGIFPEELPWYLNAAWVTDNLSIGSGFMVTVLYWAAVEEPGTAATWGSIVTHAANSAYIFVNLLISANPLRIYHCYSAIIFGAVYMIFYMIYQLRFDNEPIYDVIDWRDPGWAFLYGGVFPILTIIITWLFAYGVYRLRELIYETCILRHSVDTNSVSDHLRLSDTGRSSDTTTVYDNDLFVVHL